MGINALIEKIPDFGKDIRLNLETVLSPEGSPGLSPEQIGGVALATAYALMNQTVTDSIQAGPAASLSAEAKEAAKAAATIMGMNNVYYRTLHLLDDKEFGKMPARLRMNILGRPGIPKVEFELMSLAVSALSGCGMCINAHVHEVRKAGITNEGIQSTIRIAAVLNAAKQAIMI
jgi:alkyl hydroperoxide reductase subunit D